MGDPEPKSDVRMKSRGRQTLTGIGKKGAERQRPERRELQGWRHAQDREYGGS